MGKMNNKKIGVGLIGLGMISRAHARGYQEAEEDARVVAVCDSNGSIADTVAKGFSAKAYTRYSELLDNPDVQMVDITLPHNLHYQVAKEAIKALKHVIVEKPMASK